jgi:hypothetical protein
MQTKTTTEPTTAPTADRLSLFGLMVVLVLTNAWFFSQALTYVQ